MDEKVGMGLAILAVLGAGLGGGGAKPGMGALGLLLGGGGAAKPGTDGLTLDLATGIAKPIPVVAGVEEDERCAVDRCTGLTANALG